MVKLMALKEQIAGTSPPLCVGEPDLLTETLQNSGRHSHFLTKVRMFRFALEG